MKYVTVLKKGNACHTDLSGVMGNSQNIGYSGVVVTVGDDFFVIDRECLKANGQLKKKFVPMYLELIKKLSAKTA